MEGGLLSGEVIACRLAPAANRGGSMNLIVTAFCYFLFYNKKLTAKFMKSGAICGQSVETVAPGHPGRHKLPFSNTLLYNDQTYS